MATPFLEDATVPLFDTMGMDPGAVDTGPSPADLPLKPSVYDLPDIVLSEKKRAEIAKWLTEEITEAENDRKDLYAQWEQIQEYYEKTSIDEKKDFPFEKAAHLMLPVIATFTETIWAKVHSTIWTPSDPFSAKPLTAQFQDFASKLRRFLTWATEEELDLENASNSLFLELIKLGTCVAKVIYTRENRSMQIYDPGVGGYVEVVETFKDSPEVIPISLPDFLFPLSARNLDEAPWKAHRVRKTWAEIVRGAENGIFNNIEELKNAEEGKSTDYTAHRQKLEGTTPSRNKDFELYEVWFDYVLDETPEDQDVSEEVPARLVAWIHPKTGTILRIQHNWYPFQLDPFEVCTYIPREHAVYGIGVGQMAMPFQLEISTMHNQRIDNATLANTVGYKYKSNSRVPSELKVYPGVGIPVDEMDDFETFFLGQKYDSTITEEQHTFSFLQQRIGVQDYQNMQMQGAAATTALSIMQESTRRFDIVIAQIRNFFSRVMEKVLLLYQQFYPDGKPIMVLGEDGIFVEEIFHMSPHDIKNGVGIQVTATTSVTSKEFERQTKLSLFNLLTQYYGQLTQYVVAAENPQLPPAVRETFIAIVESLSTFVEEILEDFDIRNKHEFASRINQVRELAARAGAEGALAGNDGNGGMGAVQQPSPGAI